MNYKNMNVIRLIAETAELTPFEQDKRTRNINYSKEGTIVWTEKLIDCGVQSLNGVTFDKEKFERAVNDPRIQTKLKEKRLFGVYDHPPLDDMKEFTLIRMKDISHRINKLWWEGDILYGEFETLKTQKGRDLRGLIEMNAVICSSFRGLEMDNEYVVITFDIVSDPSCTTAKSQETTFNERLYAEAHNIAESESLFNAIDAHVLTVEPVMSKNVHMIAEHDDMSVESVIKHGSNIVAVMVESEESKRNKAITRTIRSILG